MMAEPEDAVEKFDKRLGKIGHVLLWVLWGIGVIALMFQDNYPDSFGVHLAAHGRSGSIMMFWYSYLLVGRHSLLDLLLFVWLWAPLIIFVALMARKPLRKLSAKSFSIYADKPEQGPPAP